MTTAVLLRQALRWAAGELTARQPDVSNVRVLPWSASARLQVGAEGYWVKAGPPSTMSAEQRILTAAAGLDLPVPVLVAARDDPHASLLREVPATSGRPEAADVVAALDKIRTALAGHRDRLGLNLLTATGCARACTDPPSAWINDTTADALASAIDGCGTQLAEVDRWLAGPAGLVHGDFHPGNVLSSPAGPILSDWSDAAIGARAWDLAAYTHAEDGVMGVLASLKEVADFLTTPPPVDGEQYSLSIPGLREHIQRRTTTLIRALRSLPKGQATIAPEATDLE